MAEVLVAGMAAADIVMQVDELPERSEKYRASDATITLGGCAANAAVAIARLGGTVRLAARLGRDALGDLILERLAEEGVDTTLCDRRDGARSSFSSILVDRRGERQITNFRGAGLTETLDLERVAPADAVLVDTRWPPLAKTALDAALDWAVPGVVDAEAPHDPDPVRGATHLAFSMQGLRSVEPDLAVRDALMGVQAEVGGWVAVTDGEHGVWYSRGREIEHCPAFSVAAVDTLAAGDVWHGAFALRLAEGAGERAAIVFASAAAALKCSVFGGIEACPDRAAADAFLKERS